MEWFGCVHVAWLDRHGVALLTTWVQRGLWMKLDECNDECTKSLRPRLLLANPMHATHHTSLNAEMKSWEGGKARECDASTGVTSDHSRGFVIIDDKIRFSTATTTKPDILLLWRALYEQC